MSGIMFIDPRGPYRLRKAMSQAEPMEATIRRTDDGISICMSDGRNVELATAPSDTWDSCVAAAVQWARRHGATSLTVDCEFD